MSNAFLKVKDLNKTFMARRSLFTGGRSVAVHAVRGVDFQIELGETLGLVGESGCGKSTTGRMILRLTEPTSGEIILDGTNISKLSPSRLRPLRRDMQMIFQDPFGSLNPRRTAFQTISEPLDAFSEAAPRSTRREQVASLLEQVGLSGDLMDRMPRNFSGGQRQRIGIARAIATTPRLIVADEPVSALDVSVQAQVVNLLQDLQEAHGFSMLFVAHDLAVVRHIASRLAVMYLGRIVETGPTQDIFDSAQHPYTQALLNAIPGPGRRRSNGSSLAVDVPALDQVGSGCPFAPRCPVSQRLCWTSNPSLETSDKSRAVACHFPM